MDNTTLTKCNCFTDCSAVNYDYVVLKEHLDTDKLCQNSSSNEFIHLLRYVTEYQVDVKMTKFFGIISNLSQGFVYNPNLQDECRERIEKDIGIVDVVFGSQFGLKYQRDVQMTMTGKFSDIGKLGCLHLDLQRFLVYQNISLAPQNRLPK